MEEPITTLEYFINVTINNLTDENMWVRLIIDDVDYIKLNCLLPHLWSSNVIAHKS